LDIGIDARQLSTMSYGEKHPVVMGKGEEARAKTEEHILWLNKIGTGILLQT